MSGAGGLAWLLPPELSAPAFAGFCLLSFFTSALTIVAGIGGGVTLLTVLVSFLPPAIVLPVHGVVQLGSNVGRTLLLRQHVAWPVIGWFVAGTLLGAALASQVFVTLPAGLLQTVIAVFVLWAVWGPKRGERRALPPRGYLAVGAGSGFVSLFVGGTGPLVASFLSPETLGRHRLVATHAACMTAQHGAKALAFGFVGFAYLPWLPFLAAMIAAGLAGTAVGRKLLGKLPEEHFRRLFRGVLTLLALRLLYMAWAG